MIYVLPYGMDTKTASEKVKAEFKKRFGVSYGDWCLQHKDNAILAADLTGNEILLTISGNYPPRPLKTIGQFKETVNQGKHGEALADLKQSLAAWEKQQGLKPILSP